MAVEIVEFTHSAGSFRKEGNQWLEFDQSGTHKFTFTEVGSDSQFLLVKDSSRGMFLRLPIGQCFYAMSPDGPWNALYTVTPQTRKAPRATF